MEPFFPLSWNVVHTRVVNTKGSNLFWPRYVVIVWSVFSLNVIAVVSQVKNYILTSKHKNIIVITTTEQYLSPSPEKVLLSINFFAHKQ